MCFRETNDRSLTARAAPTCAARALMRLDGKAAVITGASTGIGRATALRFAREGARLIVADLRDEQGRSLCREIEEQGGRALYVRTDVASRDDNERAIEH